MVRSCIPQGVDDYLLYCLRCMRVVRACRACARPARCVASAYGAQGKELPVLLPFFSFFFPLFLSSPTFACLYFLAS